MRYITKIIACLLLANIGLAETITLDYIGEISPPGWTPRKALKHQTLGLALSGGGLRGLAHIGVLNALEENGIHPDYIAGVSMGAIVGALYASGYSTAETEKLLRKTDWSDLFIDQPSRRSLFLNRKRTHGRHLLQIRFHNWKLYIPSSLSSGQKVGFLIDELLMNGLYRPEPDFDHLKVPFRAPATDLFTGELVVIKEGDLGEVLRASMAFPLVFSPVKTQNHTLIDGGARENIPVSTARSMGADKVLAVDISSPLLPFVDEPWEVANQVTTIMIAEDMEKSLSEADLALKPVPDSIGSFDFTYTDSLPAMGYRATMAIMDSIKQMLRPLPSEPEYYISSAVVLWEFPENLDIDPADAGELFNDDSVTYSQIKDYLTRLYIKYELDDASAEARNDTLIITLTPPPSFWHLSIKGNSVLPDTLIRKAIHSKPGKPLSYRQGVADRERILKLYRQRGYALAEIRKAELIGGSLYITIDEGKIRSLEVEGGRPSAVNELGLKSGQIFDWNIAKKGLNRLYGSDIYETVRLKSVRTDKGRKIILNLDRRSFPLIRIGARFDLERKTSGFAELVHEDIFGSGISVNLIAAPGELDAKAGASISADRILGSYVSFNAGVYHHINKYHLYNSDHKLLPGYQYERNFTILSLGQHIFRWGMLSASLRIERVFSDHPQDTPEQNLATLILESAIDTYDRYPFPRSGQMIYFSFQTSGHRFEDKVTYSRFSGEYRKWTPLVHRWSLFTRLRGGYAEPAIPTFDKFSLGGLDDFAGLHHREVLGNQVFGGSVGLRFDLLSRFLAEAFLSLRYDFAQIVDGTDELEFEKGFFRQGMLTSFALNTLLGPVELAWGWAAPNKNIPQNHLIYFSLGHDF